MVTQVRCPILKSLQLPRQLPTLPFSATDPQMPGTEPFEVLTRPTALQREAFTLLDMRLERSQ